MTTIKDIAKIAGVSITTVSRALNGYSDVSEQTRRKIRQIADKLDYSPNVAARSLVSNKTYTVGVIFSGIDYAGIKGNFAFELLCGINDRANEMGYDILLFSTNPKKQRLKSYYELCKERNVDGAIIWGLKADDPYLEEVIEKSAFPCVLIDIPFSNENLGNVSTDNVGGAIAAVDHLTGSGHTNIAMINGYLEAYVSQQRLQGYEQALSDAGLLFDPTKVVNGQFTEEGGEQAMYRILTRHPDVSAVFCASDIMALGALKALERMGRTVPDSVSIVGYDDMVISSYCTPRLTTIRQDKYKMGWEAAGQLTDMLQGNKVGHNVILRNELIVRDSTKYIN